MAESMRFFSVRYTVLMLGTRYMPSVCYPLDDMIEPAVRKMAESGEARLYPEKVRFINGVPAPIKKQDEAPAKASSAWGRLDSASANTGRRGGKPAPTLPSGGKS